MTQVDPRHVLDAGLLEDVIVLEVFFFMIIRSGRVTETRSSTLQPFFIKSFKGICQYMVKLKRSSLNNFFKKYNHSIELVSGIDV